MKRKAVIAALRVAGYHADTTAWVRLYVENRISKAVADEAWASGREAKKNGVKCDCNQCQNERITK